jgi:hypothetical protein
VHIKNSDKTRLWEDSWLMDIPLNIDVPGLYEIYEKRNYGFENSKNG